MYQASLKCGRGAARYFNFLKERPSRSAKLIRQSLDRTGAGARIRNLGQERFVGENELSIARGPAREIVRHFARCGKRQHGDRVGAAGCGRNDRNGRAQDVGVRIALRHHTPGSFGRNKDRLSSKAAGALDASPQFSQAPKLRDGEELVGVCAQPKEQQAPRGIERNAFAFERAQIGDAD